MKLKLAILFLFSCFLLGALYMTCTATEQCIDGRTEFSGRVCP